MDKIKITIPIFIYCEGGIYFDTTCVRCCAFLFCMLEAHDTAEHGSSPSHLQKTFKFVPGEEFLWWPRSASSVFHLSIFTQYSYSYMYSQAAVPKSFIFKLEIIPLFRCLSFQHAKYFRTENNKLVRLLWSNKTF